MEENKNINIEDLLDPVIEEMNRRHAEDMKNGVSTEQLILLYGSEKDDMYQVNTIGRDLELMALVILGMKKDEALRNTIQMAVELYRLFEKVSEPKPKTTKEDK